MLRSLTPTAIDPSAGEALESALRTLAREEAGLAALAAALRGPLARPFAETVRKVHAASGRLIITGVGKSGLIGRKIAATLASTGTPAMFLHAGEASHGDLGMITRDDVLLAMSWSGESAELRNVVEYSRRFRLPLIALTASGESSLAKAADIVLLVPSAAEACPHGLTPTTSTTMQLALGDALAIALLESRGFTAQDFRAFHPGGKLGASLLFVRDVMHGGPAIPLAAERTVMSEAIMIMTASRFGCLGVTDAAGRLAGIITDGDLRRHLDAGLLGRTVEEVMTRSPKTVPPETLAAAALELLNSAQITALFVVEDERPVGIVHMHDLLRVGVA